MSAGRKSNRESQSRGARISAAAALIRIIRQSRERINDELVGGDQGRRARKKPKGRQDNRGRNNRDDWTVVVFGGDGSYAGSVGCESHDQAVAIGQAAVGNGASNYAVTNGK